MTNDDEETVRLFTDVRAWSGQGVRAPHKPLLLLLALARLARERTPTSAALSFEETAPLLARLLREFGPPRSSVRPEYPFWRLQNDAAGAVWQLRSRGRMPTPNRSGDVTAAGLREAKAVGTIPAPLAKKILDRPTLLKTIVEAILDGSWESSLHADILAAVGYPTTPTFEGRRPRNPDFRSLVLRIYEQRCAFCDYDGRLGGNPLAVEAAHVRWHAAGGPDTADNALGAVPSSSRARFWRRRSAPARGSSSRSSRIVSPLRGSA
jgi:putative restriction endonuclease